MTLPRANPTRQSSVLASTDIRKGWYLASPFKNANRTRLYFVYLFVGKFLGSYIWTVSKKRN
jgi:hypothetical protein